MTKAPRLSPTFLPTEITGHGGLCSLNSSKRSLSHERPCIPVNPLPHSASQRKPIWSFGLSLHLQIIRIIMIGGGGRKESRSRQAKRKKKKIFTKMFSTQSRDEQTFSVKGQRVSVYSFVTFTVSAGACPPKMWNENSHKHRLMYMTVSAGLQ